MTASAARLPIEHAATVVERLAVLLAGGCTPASAWHYLATLESARPARMRRRWRPRPGSAGAEDGAGTAIEVARAVRSGGDPARALQTRREPAWRAVGAVHQVADATGAPLAPALRELSTGLADIGAAEREISVVLAGPISTARIVLVLPLVGLVLGAALGFDTVDVLLGTSAGAICLAVGGAGMLGGWVWNRRLVVRAGRRPATPGLGLDLIAMGLGGGQPAASVLETVRRVMRESRLEAADLMAAGPMLDLSGRAGVPAASLLRSEAGLARRRARTDASIAGARLGVQLMLPLGVCLLPAFLALGVAPLIIAILASAFGG